MYYKNIGIAPAFKEHRKEYLAGILALAAALVALSRFAVRKMVPRNVVELSDITRGLNKNGINQEFAEQAKEKILLPIMSVKKGQWRTLFEEDFANGMIIAGKDAKIHSQAFVEHASALGIRCLEVSPRISKKQNIISNIYRAVSEAKASVRFNPTNCVIIDIGNIDRAFTMTRSKASRQDVSKIENTLTSLPKGIMWTGWTTNTDKIPYYYNNTPTQLFLLP